jgi:hypothetical protein
MDNADNTKAPAGSTPALCSRTRAAGRKPSAPLTSDSARPFPDQATGARQRESAALERQAALTALLAVDKLPTDPVEAKRLARRAAELLGEAEEVHEGRRAPRAQSVVEEVEEPRACRFYEVCTTEKAGGPEKHCAACPRRRKRTERSGSGNKENTNP